MRRQEIELVDSEFRLNGKSFFIYSGEIHYFRIPRNAWEDRLRKAKKIGLNTISSYIPWIWHEPKEGHFDFKGKTVPERDLEGFIELLEKLGLYFIARPGPVTHGEISMDGLPPWLIDNHPQIRLRKSDGTIFSYPSLPTYMNSTFQRYVSKWYRVILPILEKHQVAKGGCIIALQLDNEIGMVNWLAKAADYSQTTTRFYQGFLKQKYGCIKRLNEVYKSRYKRFEDISQPDSEVDRNQLMRYWDWAFFYRNYYALYYFSLSKRAREEKIRVPLIANVPVFYDYSVCGRGIQGLMTISLYRDFSRLFPEVIFGGAYQMRRLDFENYHDISLTTEMIKMITSPGIPSICAELQVGVMSDRPRIYSSDVEMNIKTSTGHGLGGINCYLLCGGSNPKGLGCRGTYHEWQAPISSLGEERPHIEPLKLFGRFVKSFGRLLASTEKQNDITLGFYAPYYVTEYLKGNFVDGLIRKRDEFFYDGVARLLQIANINFSFLDLERASKEVMSRIPHLWIFSLDQMDVATQAKLVEYIRAGGNLVINPKVPSQNLALKRSTFLRDKLGLKIIRETSGERICLEGKEYLVGGGITIFDTSGCKVITKTPSGEACAILKKIGRGKVLIIGFGLPHIFDYEIDLVVKYAKLVGVKPSVLIEPPDIHAVIRKNEEFGFLFLNNYHDQPKETSVRLELPHYKEFIRLPIKGKITLPNRSSWILPLGIPIKDEVKIKYSTAELLEYKIVDKNILLLFHGAEDGWVEMAIDTKKPKKVILNGQTTPFEYKDGICRIQFIASGKIERLLIQP